MSSGASAMKTLEMAKSFIEISSPIDFCSNNVMNFSGKFFYSTKNNFPSFKHMLIYEKMDRFKFINTLFINYHNFPKEDLVRFSKKLPFLKNIFIVADNSIYTKHVKEEIGELDFNFLLEKNLDNLTVDYRYFYGSKTEKKILKIPKNILVKNLSLKFPSVREFSLENLGTKLFHNMGDNIETLKIDPGPLNFPRIVFGSKLYQFELINHNFNMVNKTVHIMGNKNKIGSLTIVPYVIKNSENIVYNNLRHLCFYYDDLNFESQINNFKKWFPNLVYLEIFFEDDDDYGGRDYHFTQNTVNEIYNHFPIITIILNNINMKKLTKKIIFYGNIIFKTKNVCYNNFSLYQHDFRMDVIFDSITENSLIPEKGPLVIKAGKKQKFLLEGCEIIAKSKKNVYYVVNNENENLTLIHVTKIYPNFSTKKINTLRLTNPLVDISKIVSFSLKYLEIFLGTRKYLKIDNNNFPSLERLICKNIDLTLNKSLNLLDLENSGLEVETEIAARSIYLVNCDIGDFSKLIVSRIYIFSCIFCKNTSLNFVPETTEIFFVGNDCGNEISVLFNPKNYYTNATDINFMRNTVNVKGDLILGPSDNKVLARIRHLEIESTQDLKVIINYEKIIINSGASLKLEGDNIYGNFSLYYFPGSIPSNKTFIHSYIVKPIFIKSKNIKGTLEFISNSFGHWKHFNYIVLDHINKVLTKKSSPFEFKYNKKYYMKEREKEITYNNLLVQKSSLVKADWMKKSDFFIPFENNLMILGDFMLNEIYYPTKIITTSNK